MLVYRLLEKSALAAFVSVILRIPPSGTYCEFHVPPAADRPGITVSQACTHSPSFAARIEEVIEKISRRLHLMEYLRDIYATHIELGIFSAYTNEMTLEAFAEPVTEFRGNKEMLGLDIIFNGVVYDIAFTSDISGLGTLLYDTMGASENNNYARLYKSVSKIATKQIDQIRDAYNSIG